MFSVGAALQNNINIQKGMGSLFGILWYMHQTMLVGQISYFFIMLFCLKELLITVEETCT